MIFALWLGVSGFLLTQFDPLRLWINQAIFMAGFFGGSLLWFLILARLFQTHIKSFNENILNLGSRISAILLLLAGLAAAVVETFKLF